MGGAFSTSGLITGLDSGNLIRQLMQLERQPILRIERRIAALEAQKAGVTELPTQLLTLRNRLQDFQFGTIFSQFTSAASEETVLTSEISGSNPTVGSFDINVTQLASATVANSSDVLGGAINPAATLDTSGIGTTISAGTFSINGVAFTVDPAAQSLDTILANINAGGAGVTATYDAVADAVTFANTTPGDTSIINFGATDDDSNFLDAIKVEKGAQITGGGGATEVTSTRHLGAVDISADLNTVNFKAGAITAGTFFVNGISITVDPTTDSLSDIIGAINNSDAGVNASYDSANDTIRIVSDSLGSRTIGMAAGTSNFLTSTSLAAAIQTAGEDSQFTVNGGPVLTRNSNEVADAVGDVTLNLLSLGSSTVTISADDDAIVEDVQEFLDAFNESVSSIRTITGSEGDLRGDSTLRSIGTFLISNAFRRPTGINGNFESLLDIGISTGDTFDSVSAFQLHIDAEELRDAIRDDRGNVQALFTNDAKTGIVDILFPFIDSMTSFTGPLNDRSRGGGSIDRSIKSMNNRIERIEDRVAQKEIRLRAQFARLELISAGFQQQSSFLAALGGRF